MVKDKQPKQWKSLSNATRMQVRALGPMKMLKKKKKKLIVIHEYANRYISYCLASTLRITKVIKLLQLKTY